MNIRTPQPTQAARLLKAFFSTQGVTVTHSQALEAVARLHGYQTWQALQADERFGEAPALKPLSSNEYALTAKANSAWVQVDGINVSVTRTDEGVLVDLYKKGAEDNSLAVAGLLFQEVLSEAELLLEELQQKKGVLEELGIEFGEFSLNDDVTGHSWRAPTDEGEVLWTTLPEAVEDAWAHAEDDTRAKHGLSEPAWEALSLAQQLALVKDLYAD